MGLDVGERRIGLAVGDTETGLAVPAGAVERKGTAEDWQEVLRQAGLRDAVGLVVGMPWSLDGSAGPQAHKVAECVEELRGLTDMPVVTWDERFTSAEADRRLLEVGTAARGRGRGKGSAPPKGAQDAIAAAVMLQAYLDAHRQDSGPSEG